MTIQNMLNSSTIIQGKTIIHKYNEKTDKFDVLYKGNGLVGKKIPDHVKSMEVAYIYAEGELTLEVE